MKRRLSASGVLVALAIALPWLLPPYYLHLAILALIWALFAASLNLLIGYVGLASLGHGAFFGIGAYSVAVLTVRVGVGNFWVNLLAGLGMALVFGALVGYISIRARGSYFLMLTFALAQMLWALAFKWRPVTGGDDGLTGILPPRLGPWTAHSVTDFYYFVLVWCVVAVAAMYLIVRSPFGLSMRGIRESESRMETLGYNVMLHKFIAFVLSAVFGGLAGILFSYYNGFMHPNLMGIVTSAKGLLMIVLGGSTSFVGPLVGAAVVVGLENFTSAVFKHWLLIFGSLLVVVNLFLPEGLVPSLRKALTRWPRPKKLAEGASLRRPGTSP